MSKEVKFLIYCVEEYKNAKNMTGKEVMRIFKQHDVMNYVLDCYESLHTTVDVHIIEELKSVSEA